MRRKQEGCLPDMYSLCREFDDEAFPRDEHLAHFNEKAKARERVCARGNLKSCKDHVEACTTTTCESHKAPTKSLVPYYLVCLMDLEGLRLKSQDAQRRKL